MRKLFFIACCFIIFSCSKNGKLIDGTDQNTFNTSVTEVANDLPVMQQSKFKEALDFIFYYRTNPSNTDEQRWEVVRNLVNKKNADEVFTLAEQIASEINFVWNRNQVPLANGIPKPSDSTSVDPTIENINPEDISRFDFRLTQEENNFIIEPYFFNSTGQEVQLSKPVEATIEIFNGGNIIYTKKEYIRPNNPTDLYRSNGISLSYNSINLSKLKSNGIEVLVRIKNPDKYLTQQKSLKVPDKFLGGLENAISDSIRASLTQETSMITTLATRFVQNIANSNYSSAYALTRNKNWETYQKFSQDSNITKLENSTFRNVEILDADSSVAVLQVSVSLNDGRQIKNIVTLKNINNKWFVTDFE